MLCSKPRTRSFQPVLVGQEHLEPFPVSTLPWVWPCKLFTLFSGWLSYWNICSALTTLKLSCPSTSLSSCFSMQPVCRHSFKHNTRTRGQCLEVLLYRCTAHFLCCLRNDWSYALFPTRDTFGGVMAIAMILLRSASMNEIRRVLPKLRCTQTGCQFRAVATAPGGSWGRQAAIASNKEETRQGGLRKCPSHDHAWS